MQDTPVNCQLPCLHDLGERDAGAQTASLSRRIKLAIRRRLNPRKERQLKRYTNDWANWVSAKLGKRTRPEAATDAPYAVHLGAGDLVRVRSEGEIDATLNHWRQSRPSACSNDWNDLSMNVTSA
jgi:hypothetical protein